MGKIYTFKCRIEEGENGKVSITSYSNRKIAANLFNKLNKAVHQVREDYNDEANWKKYYIKFEHDGFIYEQIESTDICNGCTFRSFINNKIGCSHPHYKTKGECTGRIYIKKSR